MVPRLTVPKISTMPSTVRPITSSYEISCEPARSAPSSENLLAEDQPASIAPMIVMPLNAKTMRMPASIGAICIG